MNNKSQQKHFSNIDIQHLQKWYHFHKRKMPWRDSPTPYAVWVSEIMLQQTQVAAVISYFNRWMEKFPTWQTLAQASEEDVVQYWAGLGYYSRARNILKAARQFLVKNKLPVTREEWLDTPGVGPYTAGAICSIAYNQAEPILDGNVERVWSRFFGCGVANVENSTQVKEWKKNLWEYSRQSVKKAQEIKVLPSDFNQSLMELGATICLPKNPKCNLCPIQKNCFAKKTQKILHYPPSFKKQKTVHLEEYCLLIQNSENQLLLLKNPQSRWRKGLWDFFVSDESYLFSSSEFIPHPILLGKVKYAITHHSIVRNVFLLKLESKKKVQSFQSIQKKMSELYPEAELKWFSLNSFHSQEPIGITSAGTKTLKLFFR